ncbi:MAG: GAF domain-containing protein [Candidatus Gastranaerophilales bacterium]|nr:GAF domain-containing protein [Candidatus Gastranaerophilales bacterium]
MAAESKSKLLKESVEDADYLLKRAIEFLDEENYKQAVKNLSGAHKIFLAYKNIAKVSVCLSLTGLAKYVDKTESYYKSLLMLEDSKFLAESTKSKESEAINKYAFAVIYFMENKYNEALYYLNYASSIPESYILLKIKAYELLSITNIKLQNPKLACENLDKAIELAKKYNYNEKAAKLSEFSQNFINLNSGFKNIHETINTKDSDEQQNAMLLVALSKIARTVNAEANLDKLLMTIAEQTKIVLNADRCSVFLYDKDKNELWSKVALGMESEEIRFPADKGFAGHVIKTGETIRIKDAYNDSRFNREIDRHTGYKTRNMLCMPIRNIKFETIGVFQVLNKKNGDFTRADEDLLFAVGTNAGIAIENNLLFNIRQKMLEEQQKLFAGFIDTLAASIDARDKITMGHSKRVRLYSELICKQINLNEDLTEIILKAAMLHDIGKIGIKDAVLQKKGALTKEEYEHIKEHVKITYDILCKTNLNVSFAEITEIAASHHEKYDGTGYFRGLKGEQIPLGGRILAVSDVFDAVTSVRHYRDRMPFKDALNIIIEGRNKHFDSKIVDAFLSVPCNLITEILISEYNMDFKEQDKQILSSLSLRDLAKILNNDEKNKIAKIFNSYYIRSNMSVSEAGINV